MGQLVDDIERIFEDQSTVFKLNLSFGFILFNNDTEEMQYYHSSANNDLVFDTPLQIRNREDLAQVREAMQKSVKRCFREAKHWHSWMGSTTTSQLQIDCHGFHQCYLLRHQTSRPSYRSECPATSVRVGESCHCVARLWYKHWLTIRRQTMFLSVFGFTQRLSAQKFRTRHSTLLWTIIWRWWFWRCDTRGITRVGEIIPTEHLRI